MFPRIRKPIPDNDNNRAWLRTELLQLLATAATLAGLCITAVSLMRQPSQPLFNSIADDIMAISALLFLLCTYLIFFALRYQPRHMLHFVKLADLLFLAALTGMVLAGFLLVYTVL